MAGPRTVWLLSGFGDEISPDLEVQCSTLEDLGMRHIEVRSIGGVNVLDLDDGQLAGARSAFDAHQIGVSSIGSPIGKTAIEEDFEPQLTRFSRALHVAEVLRAPYIRLFSFLMPPDSDPRTHRDEVLRRMAALARAAAGHEVILLHENDKGLYGDIPERCLDVVESVGSGQLRLAWDPANFVQCAVRPFSDAYSLLRQHVEYVHVKDALMATGEVVPAGQGDGELPETLRALESRGYRGFFSLEPHLASSAATGGFSGPELFLLATRAFTGLLDAQGISYS